MASGFTKKMRPRDNCREIRCCFGKLMAKQDKDHIYIRCSRCKKETRISLSRVCRTYELI